MTKLKGPNGIVFDFPETVAAALLRDRASYQLVDDVEVLEKPVEKASKGDWAAFAVQVGIDVTGMTKADIQAAVATLESGASDDGDESDGDDESDEGGDESADGEGDPAGDVAPAE